MTLMPSLFHEIVTIKGVEYRAHKSGNRFYIAGEVYVEPGDILEHNERERIILVSVPPAISPLLSVTSIQVSSYS